MSLEKLKEIITDSESHEDLLVKSAGDLIDLAAAHNLLDETRFAIEQLSKFEDRVKSQNNKCNFYYFTSVAYGDLHKGIVANTEATGNGNRNWLRKRF